MYTISILHGDAKPHPLAKLVDSDEHADAYVAAADTPHRHLLEADDVFESVDAAVTHLLFSHVDLITAGDACYTKVKNSYAVFPSARASQAIAKCRKSKGDVRKTKKGSNLKRWQREKWKDKITGKPCGHKGGPEYCRPSKKISKDTPAVPRGKALAEKIQKKRAGLRAT